jgi:ABC-2 type transport system permease protein
MVKKTLAVAWKELQVLIRDRGQLAVLFLMPVMFASVIGSAFGGGTPGIDVYLVNQDTGPYSAQIVETLHEIEALRIEVLDTVGQADKQVADGEALAAIIIPPDFSQKVTAFEPTQIRVIVDPTQQQYGGIIIGIMNEVVTPVTYQGEIQYGIRTIMDESGAFDETDPQIRGAVEAQTMGVIMTQLAEMFENPQITVTGDDLEGVETQSLDNAYSYTTPSYAVMFAFFIVGIIAATIMTEKEGGTFRRLLASPIHRGSIIAGKMLAYILVVGLQVLLVFGVGSAFFDIPLGNSPLGLLLLTLALALAATSLGMLVAALARTRSQVDAVGMVIGIVLGAVGGSIVPIPEKGFLHLLSQFTPHAHAIEGYLNLMSQGAGVVDVIPQIGLLAGVGVMFFLIAMWRFRFE